MEEIPQKTPLALEEELAEDIFTSTTKVVENGTFQVNMPLKTPKEYKKLGDSLSIAKKRFCTLEQRFQKNPNLFEEYKKFIDEYVALGHARYVPLTLQTSNLENKYFIPHLCVIREASVTTKLRVVFDASCKSSSGYSLNDVTLKGFQVQPDLYDILCRFRIYRYVLTSDIEKMYRQIRINPDQTFLQNILWREDPRQPFKCIELLTVTYGTNCAPYLATRVLNEIARLNSIKFPLASDAILSQCYVDDILGGCNDYDTLRTLYIELNTLLNKSGLRLHKWCCNSEKFLKEISQETSSEYDMNLDKSPNKVLGLKWNLHSDTLYIPIPQFSFDTPVTKRNILSSLSQCFDPMGLVNPVIVKGKILMQKLWINKLDWDTEITDDTILADWHNFSKTIHKLHDLDIPRYLFSDKPIQTIEIHGFSDASLSAYASCIYISVLCTQTIPCRAIYLLLNPE